MSAMTNHTESGSRQSSPARLRKIGLIIGLTGLLLGGIIFAFFPDSPQEDDNSLSSQYYKKQEVQVQGLWGSQGSMVLGLNRIFSRPSTYSVLIIAVSAVVGLACFY